MAYQFIDGKRVRAAGTASLPLVDPATGIAFDEVDLATGTDVERAITTARRAFAEWSRTTPAERSGLLNLLAQALLREAASLAAAESRDAGKPIRLATDFDVPGTIDNAAFFAGAARALTGRSAGEYSADHTSAIRREAIGVVGSIAPWNYPLQMAGWKVFPAVAAGNTVVLKPSELTPTTTLRLAELATEVGFPAGVFNVITGTGADAGSALVNHPDVDMVSFTGSTAVGTSIIAAAARTAKHTHMELGGKAPFVVFDDADLDAAINGACAGALINTGQDCTAATRAYVARPLFDRFVAGVADLFAGVVLGDTRDPATDLGPLVSVAHRDRVAGMVEAARRDGATVVTGGRSPDSDGAHYLPTLITGAYQRSAIVQDEVFGPVLTVIPFDTDDEALRLANDTRFGLAASAWTRDLQRANRAMRELRAGTVWINDHIPIVSDMPHGGFKQSGYGKDMSQYALDEYTQLKHVMVDISGVARKQWHRTIFG